MKAKATTKKKEPAVRKKNKAKQDKKLLESTTLHQQEIAEDDTPINRSSVKGLRSKRWARIHKPEILMNADNSWVIILCRSNQLFYYEGTRRNAEKFRRRTGVENKDLAVKRLATAREIKLQQPTRGYRYGEEVITWVKGLFDNMPKTPEEYLKLRKTPNPYDYVDWDEQAWNKRRATSVRASALGPLPLTRLLPQAEAATYIRRADLKGKTLVSQLVQLQVGETFRIDRVTWDELYQVRETQVPHIHGKLFMALQLTAKAVVKWKNHHSKGERVRVWLINAHDQTVAVTKQMSGYMRAHIECYGLDARKHLKDWEFTRKR